MLRVFQWDLVIHENVKTFPQKKMMELLGADLQQHQSKTFRP